VRHYGDVAPSASGLRSPWLTLSLGFLLIVLAAAVGLGTLLGTPGASVTPPASGRAGSASPSGSVEPSFVYPTASPAPTFTSYVVRVGDTLTSIADQFHTTPRSIGWWNRGTHPTLDPESPAFDPNTIRPGWALVLIPGITVDEANPPTPSPPPATASPSIGPSPAPSSTTTPTKTPAPTPSPAPSVAPAAVVITNGSRTSGKIALTFDMGGRLTPAVQIVQWLIDHQVHATLFPTGASGSTTTQGRAALTLAAAHPELFDVGNHSWSHPDFRTLTAAQMADEITRTEAAIRPLMGQSTKPWFRPPYGGYNLAVRKGVAAAGWSRLVMWDVDAIDWKPESDGGPTTADIVAKIKANAQGGSIVLMHLGGYNTLDALPGILGAVQAKGLAPATLGELLGG
jgi:peptidoglycan/xylan/chitin deacetylase (PgdA/CDA1 family)